MEGVFGFLSFKAIPHVVNKNLGGVGVVYVPVSTVTVTYFH